jgi:hypothetical protein
MPRKRRFALAFETIDSWQLRIQSRGEQQSLEAPIKAELLERDTAYIPDEDTQVTIHNLSTSGGRPDSSLPG